MRIYLAGPMRTIKDFNQPAFNAAAEMLRAQGHTVFNPPEKDVEAFGPDALKSETGDLADVAWTGLTPRAVIRIDLLWIIDHAEAIALLPGWEKSKGARTERALADFLGLDVILL